MVIKIFGYTYGNGKNFFAISLPFFAEVPLRDQLELFKCCQVPYLLVSPFDFSAVKLALDDLF